MAKITDYEKINELGPNSVLMVDGAPGGTHTILVSDFMKALLNNPTPLFDYLPPENKRMIFRGKNLGDHFTEEQKKEIKDGSFRDLFLGDYWEYNDNRWRIADFDYWYGTGNDEIVKDHHLVIIPDKVLYIANMNASNNNSSGYTGSDMYISNLKNAKDIIKSFFNSENILNHEELLSNKVTNGVQSGFEQIETDINIPNEVMIYGRYCMSVGSTGEVLSYRLTHSYRQLALMMVNPFFINPERESFWLRDIAGVSRFSYQQFTGYPGFTNANNNNIGVRPVFGVI